MTCDVGKAMEGLENDLPSQFILQPFRRFTYVTDHSQILPLLHLRHSLFFNPYVALPTSQLILQPFRQFTYVTTHSPTLPSLYLCHSSFSNPSVASPTSQFILQPFFRFSYVTSSSFNSPGEPPMPAFGQNCSLGAGVCSERPALGQNTLIMTMTIMSSLHHISILNYCCINI